MEKVAFIGLGAMGYPMAGHLARRFPTLVWNRTFEKALRHQEEFGSEAVPLERVAEARVIFTCLPTTREVYEVAEALYPYLREGTYWVELLLDGDLKIRYPLRVNRIERRADGA